MNQDQSIRTQALNPQQSFIVQAPAGSGKTELLTQRYLQLLATAAQEPEEVIAITFTRKAASEMRERLLKALALKNPDSDYQHTTWQLAQAVLAKDQQKQWQLLNNPNRLRILTIDALSAMLCAQTPLLSQFGAQAKISDNSLPYYQQAIQTTLENPGLLLTAVENLLLHLNNNANLLADLLLTLLSKRDQWLPHIIPYYHEPEQLKPHLEASLQQLIEEKLAQVYHAIPDHLRGELIESIGFAAQELQAIEPTHPLCSCLGIAKLPTPEIHQLAQWQAIAQLLLTQKLTWRESLTKRNGFPAHKKAEKQQMLAFITALSDYDEVRMALGDVLQCPSAFYNEQQWQILKSLMQLLPVLTAALHVQFKQHGVMDFVELTLGALNALGTPEHPTDLALHLDYQIKHLLIDEFQDTSVIQYQLIQQLVREWQDNDGKTLFLVGDPMQSIYRFRNAEVSLFIRAQQEGIGNIHLTPLTLTQNFRSSAKLVTWINQQFSKIFPAKSDISLSAIPYHCAVATQTSQLENPVSYHSYGNQAEHSQAIVMLVQTLQANYPQESIAILGRARAQLSPIITALNQANISHQAVELQALHQQQSIIDLVSLTRALMHWGDRIAWLAILRAPWCGLTLQDLHRITQYAGEKPLWPLLCEYARMGLSDQANCRLASITPILCLVLERQSQLPLSAWIKAAWLALDGPACLESSMEHETVKRYFNLLEKIEPDFSIERLEQELIKLYAKAEGDGTTRLQLMTIHKSKGLEFDHVILPELQRESPHEANQLLMWLQNPNANNADNLILAPIKPSQESSDPVHHYLKHLENQKLHFEAARLLYVAVTRAKKSLHLFCQLKHDKETDSIKQPSRKSLLNFLWPQLHQQFTSQYLHETTEAITNTAPYLKRLAQDWQSEYTIVNPNANQTVSQQSLPYPEENKAAIIGTLIHEALERASNQEYPTTNYWQKRFLQAGMKRQDLPQALAQMQLALDNTHNDTRGQWILKAHHDAQSECAITTQESNQWINYIIDRTFIDEQGWRWIIDYKTTAIKDLPLAQFLVEQKQTYQEQLENYARAWQKKENRPIKLGLYFPLYPSWLDWEFNA